MTFEQFQATKTRKTVAEFCNESCYTPDHFAVGHVLVYEHGLHIEDNEGKGYYLILDRDDYMTPDLESLERLLFDWAGSGGYFE